MTCYTLQDTWAGLHDQWEPNTDDSSGEDSDALPGEEKQYRLMEVQRKDKEEETRNNRNTTKEEGGGMITRGKGKAAAGEYMRARSTARAPACKSDACVYRRDGAEGGSGTVLVRCGLLTPVADAGPIGSQPAMLSRV